MKFLKVMTWQYVQNLMNLANNMKSCKRKMKKIEYKSILLRNSLKKDKLLLKTKNNNFKKWNKIKMQKKMIDTL